MLVRPFLLVFSCLALSVPATATEKVTVAKFVRAETDTAIRNMVDQVGLGKFYHLRAPTPLENQLIIRMNRDTLYSPLILDLSKPATVTLPDPGDRYMSLHVVNQDHYMFAITKPGRHRLTRQKVGSRYAFLTVRIFADANDPADIARVNALQDKLKVEGGGTGPLDMPDWNQDQLKTARAALNTLAKMGVDPSLAFGTREETDPVQHFIGAAAGWGGLPRKNAFYTLTAIEENDGTPYVVRVKDVPVDAFWSITVYNADGYLEKNDRDAYSFNNITARSDKDGTVTIHFGGCEDGRINCLPITEGWNYAARMYQPRKEILNGSWTFPDPIPMK